MILGIYYKDRAMSEQNNLTPERKQPQGVGPTRRDFISKVAITSPVLAAFVSKPSWSIDNNCINSGTLSGNLSNHSCQALARNWQWWRDNRNLWNSGQIPGITPSTTFQSIFGTKPLARLNSSNNYYKNNKLNNDGSVQTLLSVGGNSSIKAILNGKTRNSPSRRAADVDKAIIAAYLNIMHPGIAYDGYVNVGGLLADYQTAIANYMTVPNNLIFDDLYDLLEGANGFNNNEDITSVP